MIPLAYQLRPGVRIEAAADGSRRIVSGVPLSVLRVNAAAARLLESTRGGVSVLELAAGLSLSEERCVELCEGFRRRGILEVGPAACGEPDLPSVTVVVPTKDRPAELAACLAALARLDYPTDLLEVVVVDDGSDDPAAVARVVTDHRGRLLVNHRNRGPAQARNRAAREATGQCLAFIDSDCVADPGWLRGLAPYLAWSRVAAVGGRTVPACADSALDRYEEVSSPLDMGTRLLFEAGGSNSLYVPTCNLLVRRDVFLEVGGLREELRVGEDVDLCWRLREQGHVLVYAPEGVVRHRHPARLRPLLRRRADYGSSEARLHAMHPDKRGRLVLPPAAAATVALVSAGVVARRRWLLAAALVSPAWDAARRVRRLRDSGADVAARDVLFSTLRGHLSALYFAYFRLVRYHLGALMLAGLVVPGVRLLAAVAILYAAGVDYLRRRPRLGFPAYLGFYAVEHAAYQTGVLAGHLAAGSLPLGPLPVVASRIDPGAGLPTRARPVTHPKQGI